MNSIITKNIDKIREICREHYVNKLYIFGSVLTNQFHQNSDLDLVVDFKNINPKEYVDNYFDFKYSLENIFSRNVDLLEEKGIKNPYFLKEIKNKMKIVYGN
ncbi:MAG: nucleotidyltransferase domain-containing protein [Flavobacteriales bacterium]|nr:nucleotidyltransferase domain-containing protein [Flavobacteriales bacterium]